MLTAIPGICIRIHPSRAIVRTAMLVVIALASVVGVSALSSEAETCLACHSDAAIAPVVNLDKMELSVHGAFDCATCHPGATEQPHNAAKLKADCSQCHSTEVGAYSTSVHGKASAGGDNAAATCLSCHGDAHAILPAADPGSAVYHANLPQTCGQCHSKGKLPKDANSSVNNAFDLYTDSIHGKATMKSGLNVSANCSDCHGAHEIQPGSNPVSPVNRANVPATCGKCHVDVLRNWQASSHADALKAGKANAPVCTDCHIAHTVNRVEDPKALNALMGTCSNCHHKEFETYRATFHGEASQLGEVSRVATCSSCHGAHLVLPSVNPLSPTSSDRLLSTCQKCHPGANASFTGYKPHVEPQDPAKNPALHYIWLFMTALLFGVFGFFGLHTVLWLVHSLRTGQHRRNKEGKEAKHG